MSTGDRSIFCSLLWDLSPVVCSFPCRGHLLPLLNLFLSIWSFFRLVNGIVFLYSFSICSLLVYRKATDFCKLILYPDTLLKLFKGSSNLVEIFRYFTYNIMSSQIDIVWLLLYLFIFLLFLLPAFLLWVGKIPRVYWIGEERMAPMSFSWL
jgi:hypothetical protein